MTRSFSEHIMEELGIDGSELDRRKEFISISEEDISLLKSIYKKAPWIPDRIADLFLSHLHSFEETRAIIEQDSATHIKEKVSKYFAQLFEGKYDLQYVSNRLSIGYRHNIAGVEPKYYIGAYGEAIKELIPIIKEHTGDDKKTFSETISALFRVVLFDITNAMEAYLYEKQLKIKHMNTFYSVLSKINEFIIRVSDINELFEGVCPIIVDDGGFKFAWIGLLDKDTKEIRPVAMWGDGEAYIKGLKFYASEDLPGGISPAGKAILEGKIVVSEDIDHDARMISWRRGALGFGFRAYASIPIRMSEEVIGALTIYSGTTFTFGREEMRLLEEIAGDISFAIGYIGKLQKTQHISLFDPLTDLPNRNHILQELQRLIDISGASGKSTALIVMDIDWFKGINETIGYAKGDTLLKQIVKMLMPVIKEDRQLGRIGPDEFAIIGSDINNEETIYRTVENINSIFANPVQVDGENVGVSFSMGISIYPNDGDSAEELVKIAEASLMQIKGTGIKGIVNYSPAINSKISGILKMKNNLVRAIENKEFIVYYEPKVNIKNYTISGVEALVRWQNPDEGLILPSRFIPLLEETGMIVKVGQWVFEEAAKQVMRWNANGYNLKVAINVSAAQIEQKDFVKWIITTAMDKGIDPLSIELEITESLIMKNVDDKIEKLLQLRDYGIMVAVDDFGTGYSSLAYLKRLPVSSLKIDISFIKSLPGDKENTKITETIISLAKALNLKTIAEGVDRKEQIDFLRKLGCDEAQGYYFTMPLPAPEFEKFAASFSKKH
jgi:diguanylate cyclase (GGDEF)-like protein